jgi:hypothetical protein
MLAVDHADPCAQRRNDATMQRRDEMPTLVVARQRRWFG